MKKRFTKNTNDMIYTPIHHIPMGQAIKMPNGEYGVRIKKDKDTFEEVSMGYFNSQMIKIADAIV